MSKLRLIPYAVLTAGGLVAASGGANAQSMYDVNQMQNYQQDRIQRGVNDGQITRGEENRLEQGEHAINRAQRQAEADGHVSPQERAHIDHMVQQENRQISRDSHNDRQQWGRDGHEGWGRGWDNRGGDNRGGW